MRFSKSTNRGCTNTGWVCESMKPGRTTWLSQSISSMRLRFFLNQGSRTASFVFPTETIFPPMQSTAASSMMARLPRSGPRRGPGLPERRVRSCPIFSNSRGRVCFWIDRLAGMVVRLLAHRHFHVFFLGELSRIFIACVSMPNDAHPWIGGQHALDPLRHHLRSIGDCDLPGMQRVADADSA